MATGLAIMGFGGGAMIAAPLSNILMKQFATPQSVGVAVGQVQNSPATPGERYQALRKELEKVVTRTPGTLDFLPNETDQHRRLLAGDKMTIVYGPQNSVQSFATTKATTETFPNQLEIARAKRAYNELYHSDRLAHMSGAAQAIAAEKVRATCDRWDGERSGGALGSVAEVAGRRVVDVDVRGGDVEVPRDDDRLARRRSMSKQTGSELGGRIDRQGLHLATHGALVGI
jgi:hypothetical protein